MVNRRIRTGIIALFAVVIAVLLGARVFEFGPWATRSAATDDSADSDDSQHVTAKPRQPRPVRRSAPDLDRDTPAQPRDAGSGASDGRTHKPKYRFKLARLFGDDCAFGVDAHCQEWRLRADRCNDGDGDACEQLGDLLIGEPPMQPLWGARTLQYACEQGRSDACERGNTWYEWSTFGYKSNPSPDEQLPAGLQDACEAGDQVACGLIQMRRVKSEKRMDEPAALTSCRAGFRDVCAIIIDGAQTAQTLIAALKAGCDIPDAWLCYHLSGYYSTYCPDPEQPACPDPDPTLAAHYRTLACQLEPDLEPCKAQTR